VYVCVWQAAYAYGKNLKPHELKEDELRSKVEGIEGHELVAFTFTGTCVCVVCVRVCVCA
jgi:hypothetical protein